MVRGQKSEVRSQRSAVRRETEMVFGANLKSAGRASSKAPSDL